MASNFAWLSILQIMSYAFPLITIPYVARIVGTDGIGDIAFAAAVMIWFQTVAEWGFNLTATRDIAVNRENPQKVNHIFTSVFISRVLLMIVSGLVLAILIWLIPKFRANWLILFYTFLMIPGQVLACDWLFQGLEKMKYMTILNVLARTIFTALIFIFIKQPTDYVLQPLFLSLGFIVSGAISFYIILGPYKVRLTKVTLADIGATIKSSADVFINTILPNFYNAFSVMLLGFWGGPYYNGIYDAGHKCVNISNTLFGVMSRAFFPFLSRRIDRHNIYQKISLAGAILCALVLFIFAPLIIDLLYGEAFMKGVIVLRIQSLVVIFYVLNDVYGKNYLIIVHQERLLRNITAVCSLIGFAMAFPMVYYLKDIGVAITTTVSLGLIGISTFIASRRLQKKAVTTHQP